MKGTRFKTCRICEGTGMVRRCDGMYMCPVECRWCYGKGIVPTINWFTVALIVIAVVVIILVIFVLETPNSG